ncbi:hypothetical protein [Streptomyces noursei]
MSATRGKHAKAEQPSRLEGLPLLLLAAVGIGVPTTIVTNHDPQPVGVSRPDIVPAGVDEAEMAAVRSHPTHPGASHTSRWGGR